MALVLEWAADHRDELLEDWNLGSSPYRVGDFRIILDLLKHAGENLET